ncbi:guanylate kinase isoform X2 [Homalodisca vitripennis]|uniref:guanylate kinase isoform X2 n=1 Tax=Homalodisca vitripennis TaxID=197043 RepID=UPI001EEA55B7|nr:guanylate kinase isoform X2 [Homalodisca vitripennis]
MVRQGPKVLVLCGPSGSGKSSLLRLLFEEFPDKFGFSVSHTTRNPRPGEENGKHYHFTTKEEMEQAITRGEFIESAVFSNNMYGTSVSAVRSVCESGKVCVLDIDVEGVKQVKTTDLNPLLVFIKPPSLADLETRLRGRKTETEDSLQRRLDAARKEMVYGETPGNFHLIVINDNLDKAYKKLKEFVLKELEKTDDKGKPVFKHEKLIALV